MKPWSSEFLFCCAVWIAGSATMLFLLQRDTDRAQDRLTFALSTVMVAGVVWVVEHLAWRKS